MLALVVFHGHGAGFWPRLFGRAGFRHCFVALNDDRAWVVLDACGDGTRISADVAADYDLAAFYRLQGFTVLEASLSPPDGWQYPVWFFTCVEACKRILGVRGWWIWTPYQLFKHLEKAHGLDLQPAQAESATSASAAPDA